MGKRPKKQIIKAVLSCVLVGVLTLSGILATNNTAYAASADGTPTAVNGRILTPRYSGDSVDWIEIAQCGDYSLIVRSSWINWYAQASRYGDPSWQYAPYAYSGSSSEYSTSRPRGIINEWFNGGGYDAADRLPADARMRNFTVANNAFTVRGTAGGQASLTNGFSRPTTNYVRSGSDVAFALSYSEVANFFSKQYDVRGANPQVQTSSATAQANFNKIKMPDALYNTIFYTMFLRSPGDSLTTSTAGGLISSGRVFQIMTDPNNTSERGLMYPALWVDSDIFEPDYAYVTVEYKDAETGEMLAPADTYNIDLFDSTSYGPYYAKDIRFYEAGVLAPYSAPISGTATKDQEITITYLYSLGEATIVVECRDSLRGTLLSSSTEIVPAGDYGPYGAPVIPLYTYEQVSPLSAPVAGEIERDENLTIIFLYQRRVV